VIRLYLVLLVRFRVLLLVLNVVIGVMGLKIFLLNIWVLFGMLVSIVGE